MNANGGRTWRGGLMQNADGPIIEDALEANKLSGVELDVFVF